MGIVRGIVRGTVRGTVRGLVKAGLPANVVTYNGVPVCYNGEYVIYTA